MSTLQATQNRRSIDTETLLWAVGVITFMLGDTLLTAYGLSNGAVEANPAGAAILSTGGIAGMIVAKTVALAFGVALYRLSPREYRIGVPVGLSLVGVFAVTWNVIILLVLL